MTIRLRDDPAAVSSARLVELDGKPLLVMLDAGTLLDGSRLRFLDLVECSAEESRRLRKLRRLPEWRAFWFRHWPDPEGD